MKKILLVLLPLLIIISACTTFTPDEQERIDFVNYLINNPHNLYEKIKASKYYDSTFDKELKNGGIIKFFENNLIESQEKKVEVEIEVTPIYNNFDRIKEFPGYKTIDSSDYFEQPISIIFDRDIIRPHIYSLSFKNFKDGKWILTQIAVDMMSY